MSLDKMWEFLKLTRFEHALMLAFGVLLSESMVLGRIPDIDGVILLSLIVPILTEMAAFTLNDYFDIETDRMNGKKDRPLVKGSISETFALRFSIVCMVVSVLIAGFINWKAFLIVLVFNGLSVLYNWKIKDYPLVGNMYIASTMAIPFVFGNVVVTGDLALLSSIVAAMAFVAGLAREIIKTVQDIEGDTKARKSRTLPTIIGSGNALIVAEFLYLVFIPMTALPFYLGLVAKDTTAILIVAADLMILFIVFKLMREKESAFKFARDLSLVAFMLGMIGMLTTSI